MIETFPLLDLVWKVAALQLLREPPRSVASFDVHTFSLVIERPIVIPLALAVPRTPLPYSVLA